MRQHDGTQLAVVALLVGAAIGIAVGAAALGTVGSDSQPETADSPDDDRSLVAEPGSLSVPIQGADESTLEQFGTAESFRAYVRAGQRRTGVGARPPVMRGGVSVSAGFESASSDAGGVAGQGATDGGPDRIAGSNVQVDGIDEPDIVKTDGQNFYYSPTGNRVGGPRPVEPPVSGDSYVPPERDPTSHVVGTSDPATPAALAALDTGGQLLQTGDRLVVFDETKLAGYDVSDPADPVASWTLSLEDPLVTARETGGQLYIVTRTAVGPATECPIRPLGDEAIACGDIYAPDQQTSAGVTYTAFSVDATDGAVEDSVSMVGTGVGTVVYVSPDSLYLTDTTGLSESDLRVSWAEESAVVPADLAERIAEIDGYNISERSKRTEMRAAIARFGGSNPNVSPETLQEDLAAYRRAHQENLTRTNIVRIDVDEARLAVEASGTVPGEPLNQFALDEYEDTLRITTTVPRVAGAESDNHLYVLDSGSLAREASVEGMGHDQRVYAVRYVGDTAYVVTFRQVDPFYVIDFETPTEPELRSELELPGFSSYLHPADDDHVIGIGEESGQVKAVLFDVTDPTDTAVADDIVLDSFWSAVSDSHHAFTIDRRHGVFVLPAGNTAKVVDYTDGSLDVVADVTTDEAVTRARYVDDYLYIFAGGEVVVLDQTDWERTSTLSLDD